MMKRIFSLIAAGLGLWLFADIAVAHITLSEPKAEAGSYYKATLRVGHGCNGSPTHGLVAQIPVGFQGVKPQPKTGWTVATRKAQLGKPYNSHGKIVTEDVVELRWLVKNKEAALLDEQFDEFAFMGRVPDSAGPLWIKVLQLCENGQNDWSEMPAHGTSSKGLKSPAVLLDVQPAPTHEHDH